MLTESEIDGCTGYAFTSYKFVLEVNAVPHTLQSLCECQSSESTENTDLPFQYVMAGNQDKPGLLLYDLFNFIVIHLKIIQKHPDIMIYYIMS